MASKRILKELKDLQKDPPTSCSADTMLSPKPSSSLDMGFWNLKITIISTMDLKARDDVYLVVSLSGNQKQRAPINKKEGSTNPWSGHTFVFTVDKATVHASSVKFEIKKAKGNFCLKKGIFRLKKCIGQVNVPVRDLLAKGGASDVTSKVMSLAVTSSSKETVSILYFSYEFKQQFPIDSTAEAPSASNSAPSYPPPAPGPVQYTQPTDLANAALPYGNPPPVNSHPPAGHGEAAPPPNAGRSFMLMLIARLAVEGLMSILESIISGAWF